MIELPRIMTNVWPREPSWHIRFADLNELFMPITLLMKAQLEDYYD